MSKTIVIVDESPIAAYRLRASLLDTDARAYVCTDFAPALDVIAKNLVDTVVVVFSGTPEAVQFCDAVRSRHIPLVFSSPPIPESNPQSRDWIA